jgi:phage portal protein BeeE
MTKQPLFTPGTRSCPQICMNERIALLSAYQTGIEAGFLSSNEVRRWESLNARPGGDAFVVLAGASLQPPDQQQTTEGARPNGAAP